MKKLLLILSLSLGVLSATPVMAAAPTFSTQKIAQTKLSDLSFKQVMRTFYNGQMTSAHVENEDIEAMPYIGLSHTRDGYQTVGVMHPVVTYKNLKGETRYLVLIEKVITDDRYQVQRCHVCRATADVYSFKRLDDGRYQLVSKSHPDAIFPSNYGRVEFDSASFLKGLQPLGKNIIGSIFTTGDYFSGATFSWWEALHLPEDDFIDSIMVGDAGSDYAGSYEKDSPLYYEYEVTYKVIPDKSKYYPIMLTFKGDKPFENDYQRIESVNYSKIMKFNPIKKEYE